MPAQANARLSEPVQLAQSAVPTTYMTAQGPNEIIVQISDGNFYFRDILHRGYGNTYQATDHGIRVNYDRDSGRVVIISDETGAEIYNYFFTEPSSVTNSNASSYDDYTTGPPSFAELLRVADNEYAAEFSDGQFYFNGSLYRSSGDVFVGSDGHFRVTFDRGNNRVVIINLYNGEELFNYIYSEANEGFL
jgi:outer membrane lipoprotein-sorting protein